MMRRFPSLRLLALPALSWFWALSAAPTRADISFVDSFRNVGNLQTGDGNTLSAGGAFFSLELTSTVANNYSSVTSTYPGPGSPVGLPQTDSVTYHFQSPALATKAVMDAAYPFGTYSFSAVNGGTTDTTSYQYTADDYARTLPFLTGTNFSALQGLDPTKSFAFLPSTFTTGGTASSSFMFLTVFDLDSNAFVFNAGFLAATTTSIVMPANTLLPGHHFSYELDFSNRDLVASPGATFQAQLGFDVRTDGLFTTAAAAVPEPSSWTHSCLAITLGCAVAAWRRRPRAATPVLGLES